MTWEELETLIVPRDGAEKWSLSDWGCALAGEVGELCSGITKSRRGRTTIEGIPVDQYLRKEIADVVLYAILFARVNKFSLKQAVMDKYAELLKREEHAKETL